MLSILEAMSTSDDAALLQKWRTGDQQAGQCLFMRYYDSVERFFGNKMATGVADLVQETFLACVQGEDRLRDPNKFRSFLFSIAHNVLYEHLRKRYRHGQVLDFDELSIEQIVPSPVTLLIKHREQRLLLHALRSIPLESQVILELHYWEQLTGIDIAEFLQKPVGTAKSRMRLARQRLKNNMSKLAESRELLRSTTDDLENWARRCRQAMSRSS